MNRRRIFYSEKKKHFSSFPEKNLKDTWSVAHASRLDAPSARGTRQGKAQGGSGRLLGARSIHCRPPTVSHSLSPSCSTRAAQYFHGLFPPHPTFELAASQTPAHLGAHWLGSIDGNPYHGHTGQSRSFAGSATSAQASAHHPRCRRRKCCWRCECNASVTDPGHPPAAAAAADVGGCRPSKQQPHPRFSRSTGRACARRHGAVPAAARLCIAAARRPITSGHRPGQLNGQL